MKDLTIFKGSSVIKLYVPSTNYDITISQDELERRFIQGQIVMSKIFGGCSRDVNPIIGSYVSNDGSLITESIYLIESSVPDNVDWGFFIDNLETLKKMWNQESIAIKIVKNEFYKFI